MADDIKKKDDAQLQAYREKRIEELDKVIELSLNKISTRSGVFSIGDGTTLGNKLSIIISDVKKNKFFFAKKYTGTSENPDCSSGDGLKPDTNIQKPISPSCVECKYNEWGSAKLLNPDAGETRKACPDYYKIVGYLYTNDNIQTNSPFFLLVPPTSINNFTLYYKKIKLTGYALFDVVTNIVIKSRKSGMGYELLFDVSKPLTTKEQFTVANLR